MTRSHPHRSSPPRGAFTSSRHNLRVIIIVALYDSPILTPRSIQSYTEEHSNAELSLRNGTASLPRKYVNRPFAFTRLRGCLKINETGTADDERTEEGNRFSVVSRNSLDSRAEREKESHLENNGNQIA